MRGVDVCPLLRRGLELRAACDGCEMAPVSGMRHLKRGDVVAAQGLPARHAFAVVSGWLKESVVDEEGKAQVVRLYRAGDLASAVSIVEPTYPATIEALGPAKICEVPVATLAERMTSAPLAGPFARALLSDLGAMRRRVVALGALSGAERVSALLDEMTMGNPPGRWTRLPVTRTEMAELLGLAQETVSRIVQRLARAGEFEVRGRWVRRAPEPADLGSANRRGNSHGSLGEMARTGTAP